MVGWHHQLDEHESEQAAGVGDGQGSLACCGPWGHKELDTAEQLNNNNKHISTVQFDSFNISSVAQLCLILCDPRTAALQASLSITNSQSLLKLMSIESVMPANHLILCRRLLLPSIFPSIRVFSNESILHIRWPKYWSFSFGIIPSNEYSGLFSFRID